MSDPFLAEIRIFGFGFAPRGWATCDGQIMPISQNTALFSLLGTNYGGNGTSTFGLPNLQNSAPIAPGSGPGLTQRVLGETGGETGVTLTIATMTAHTHSLMARAVNANINTAGPSNAIAKPFPATNAAFLSGSPGAQISGQAISANGGSQPHNNMQPYLTLLYCIALQGIFPQRP